MEAVILGIDVGKFVSHCALLVEGSVRANHFPNSTDGFKRLHRWLKNRHIERVHACLEATGGWSEELGTDLHAQGHVVSIVNPLAIKSFGQSELSRTKTDKADAALIARFSRGDASRTLGTAEPVTAALTASGSPANCPR